MEVLLHNISMEARKRQLDSGTIGEIAQSIARQGLLQNIGVKDTGDGRYRLVYGAHRLEAVKSLGWTTIEARVFPGDTSDDECLLAEIQENNARKELTGAERKAFAAEVGRLITQIFENSQTKENSHREFDWFREFKEKSGIGQNTAYTWWSSFCAESALSITPKQATTEHRAAFFDWLERHKAEAEAERQRKAIEAAAEKARKEAEAYEQQKSKSKAALFRHLNGDAKEWGAECVKEWLEEWAALDGQTIEVDAA